MVELLDYDWKNIEIVKENLQFIKEHYNQYLNNTGYGKKKYTRSEIFDLNRDKEWFVCKEYYYDLDLKDCINESDVKRGQIRIES